MPSTASSTYADFIEGKLIAAITTGTTTGITVKIKQVNGATPTWPTAAHRIKIVQKTATNNKVEKLGIASGTTQSGQTVTLGTATRALPLSNGTDFTGSATAVAFAAGADVFITWDSHDAAQTPKLDIANTFTAKQTFSVPARYAVYATSGDLPAGGNGDGSAYVTADGVFYDYIAGAWSQRATGTTANGSTTVAGKFEEATVAEQGSATATGGSGARLVPAVANLVKTSSGAGDENKIPLLQSDGTLVEGFLGTGTANSSKYLRGDGSWQNTSDLATTTASYTAIANSTAITAGGTGDQDLDLSYTVGANDLAAGVEYEFEAWGIYNGGTNDRQLQLKLKFGSTTLIDFANAYQGGASTNRSFHVRATVVCRSAGASGTVLASGNLRVQAASGAAGTSDTIFERFKHAGSTVTVDTTASAALKLSQTWNTDDGTGKSVQLNRLRIVRFDPV